MSTFAIDLCPHCGTANVAVTTVAATKDAGTQLHGYAYGYCGKCSGPISASFLDAWSRGSFEQNLHVQSGDPETRGFMLIRYFPQPATISAPDHLPPQVKRAFEEGERCIKQGMWNAGAMSLRRALDVGTKIMLPEFEGMLYARINKLGDEHLITPALKQWSHHLRLEGNGANHDIDDVEEADAKVLLEFARYLLIYLFTLPEQVSAAQAAK